MTETSVTSSVLGTERKDSGEVPQMTLESAQSRPQWPALGSGVQRSPEEWGGEDKEEHLDGRNGKLQCV